MFIKLSLDVVIN